MALMQRALPLPMHAPTPPDHILCHVQNGAQPIRPIDCQTAIDTDWPSTNTHLRYFLSDPRPSDSEVIPTYSYLGSCRVALETAGPIEHLPHSMLLCPSELRGLAGYLIQKCAVEGDGIGGWLTLGFTNAMSWVHDSRNLSLAGNFLTISIEPRAHMGVHVQEPGSRNPNIAARLSGHAAALGDALGNVGGRLYYDLISRDLHNRALEMAGNFDPNLTWWSKDGKYSWWARQFRRREDSSSTETQESSSNRATGTLRPNVSSALNDTSGSMELEDAGATSGNFTLPTPDLDDDNDSGEAGDDEKSSGEDDGNTPYAPASEGGGLGDEEMAETNDHIAEGMNNLGLDAGDMTYQCDDSLGGGPDPVDCEKLSWSGLKPPDSVETLQSNVPQFYTQGTCGFVVSSITPTTILWSHLLTAFDMLNMFCVQNPISKAKGGRAYYGQQRVSSWINGKARKRRDLGSSRVDATEALPRGINATIFRHDAHSDKSCEWVLAEEGKNLTNCRGV